MREEWTLIIIELNDGRWKFDLRTKMNDDEIRKLLGRIKHVENELKERLETEVIKVSDTIEFLRRKK